MPPLFFYEGGILPHTVSVTVPYGNEWLLQIFGREGFVQRVYTERLGLERTLKPIEFCTSTIAGIRLHEIRLPTALSKPALNTSRDRLHFILKNILCSSLVTLGPAPVVFTLIQDTWDIETKSNTVQVRRRKKDFYKQCHLSAQVKTEGRSFSFFTEWWH